MVVALLHHIGDLNLSCQNTTWGQKKDQAKCPKIPSASAGKMLEVVVVKMPMLVKPVLSPSVRSITWAFEKLAIADVADVEFIASETS